MLASGSRDKTIRLWDAVGGQPLATLEGHEDRVHSVVFSPAGRILASRSEDVTVRLWDIGERQLRFTLATWADAMAFSPDGRTLATGSGDGITSLWDAGSGRLLATLEGDARLGCHFHGFLTGREDAGLRGPERRCPPVGCGQRPTSDHPLA